jgi:hypothetical protein
MAKKEDAARFLCNAPSEQCFWVNNGPVLKNVEELADTLQQISDDTYRYHANKEKNDFSRWILEVIGDQKLANDLLSSRSKVSAVKKLKTRISLLKKKAA